MEGMKEGRREEGEGPWRDYTSSDENFFPLNTEFSFEIEKFKSCILTASGMHTHIPTHTDTHLTQFLNKQSRDIC